ncbi:FxDxF family PEP-CTERM protein [Neiella marina]|uniref:FxDxF family PEP-CTERM protein n=1 Tax=Neiella holothuriorum TaxID=2870530 RepID=A0ABS7EE32_9GAMM|nr:FxDxF family PEP-CTERM protein [Neiella holothuriorum]MBW8190587.1 FxDxF family PEP-CTERM protein [Neiella holothuriorum]
MSIRGFISTLVLICSIAAIPTKAIALTTFDGGQHGELEVGFEIIDTPSVFSGVFEFTLSEVSYLSFTAISGAFMPVSLSLSSLDSATTYAGALLAPGSQVYASDIMLNSGSYKYVVSSESSANVGSVFGFASSVTPVPEPSVYAMLFAGLGVVGFAARRRQRNKQ